LQISDQPDNSSSGTAIGVDEKDGSEETDFDLPRPTFYKRQLTSFKSEDDESDMMASEANRSKILENTLSSPDVSSA